MRSDNPGGWSILGVSPAGAGVVGVSTANIGIAGQSQVLAGYFDGPVRVTGPLYKNGGGFQIDHPQDPANKYLAHSFVESPDMKNVYDGVVTLDASGEAEVSLPSWFEAINKDFRYQLTAIGAPAPDLYIAEKLRDNRFRIAGGQAGLEVCWQVTGIRADPWAEANRIEVEQDKSSRESGHYLSPEHYGQSDHRHIRQVLLPRLAEILEQPGPHLPLRYPGSTTE